MLDVETYMYEFRRVARLLFPTKISLSFYPGFSVVIQIDFYLKRSANFGVHGRLKLTRSLTYTIH